MRRHIGRARRRPAELCQTHKARDHQRQRRSGEPDEPRRRPCRRADHPLPRRPDKQRVAGKGRKKQRELDGDLADHWGPPRGPRRRAMSFIQTLWSLRVADKYRSIFLSLPCKWGSLLRCVARMKRLEHLPVILTIYSESWPGLSRPSTSFWLKARKKDLDARDKRGHDGGEVIRSHRNAV